MTKTNRKARGRMNNNETFVKDSSLKVKTHLRGGAMIKYGFKVA